MKIIKAVFDDDKFEARITFEDATQFIINCPAAEKQADLKLNEFTRPDMFNLREKHTVRYTQLLLNGKLQEYLDNKYLERKTRLDFRIAQWSKRYPDMSESQIFSLIRECEMYGD